MKAYYNEWEKFPAQWLRNLSAAGYIAEGHVDERSIEVVAPEDVRGAQEAHFFAGIGIWSYALQLAGWPTELVRTWTGSCPCQPFSSAGKGKGFDDERHLWPVWFKLIEAERPHAILGEQSASPGGLEWFDAVSADLERAGYTVGAVDSCSAGVGAPHIRQRLYFVAYSEEFRWPEGWNGRAGARLDEAWKQFERHGDARGVADAVRAGWAERRALAGQRPPAGSSLADALADAGRLPDARHERRGSGAGDGAPEVDRRGAGGEHARRSSAHLVADADGERLEGQRLQLRERGPLEDLPEAPGSGEAHRLVDATGLGRGQDRLPAADGAGAHRGWEADQHRHASAAHGVADPDERRQRAELGDLRARQPDDGGRSEARELGDASSERGGRHARAVPGAEGEVERAGLADRHVDHEPLDAGAADGLGDAGSAGLQERVGLGGVPPGAAGADAGQAAERAGAPTAGFWGDALWLYCRDGKYRPTESRLVEMADGNTRCLVYLRPLIVGAEGRVGKIKAYGNAINALQAATFVRAARDSMQHL